MIGALATNNTTTTTTTKVRTIPDTFIDTSTSSVITTPTLIPTRPTLCAHFEFHNDNSNFNNIIMQPTKSESIATATNSNSTQSSSMHCSSLSGSANQTVHTISTNNTLNSFNPNINAVDGVVQNHNHSMDNCGIITNENSIPSGYSVHIKASINSQGNSGALHGPDASNGTTSNMTTSSIRKFDSTACSASNSSQFGGMTSTSTSSAGSSPMPPNNNNNHNNNSNNGHSSAGSFSTATTASTNFNQLPTLASSDSLNAFNFFDGLSLPPAPISSTTSNAKFSTSILTTPSNTSHSSSLTTALFNTNPPTTASNNPLNPLTSNNIVTDETVAQIVSNTSVPEFLYQLTKMLTDDHRDIIEWSNGKIEVHNPTKLEKEVLNQYFRHSKYASFQRQLNYFGFRKLAGKGKMAPCSYVNENATSDLRSLLRMKRKTSANTKDGKANDSSNNNTDSSTSKPSHGRSSNNNNNKKSTSNKRARTIRQQQQQQQSQQSKHPYETLSGSSGITIAKKSGIKHQLNNFGATTSSLQNLNTSSSQISSSISNPLGVPDPMTSLDPVSIAKSAVGKGVTHQYNVSTTNNNNNNTQNSSRTNISNNNNNNNNNTNNNNTIGISNSVMSGIPTDSSNKFTFLDPSQLGMGIESYMSELQTNFRNSLNEANAQAGNNNNEFNSNNMNNQSMNQSNDQQCSLPRESSLVDLAIIPSLTSALPQAQTSTTSYIGLNNKSESDYGMTFIDFPMDNSTLGPPDE